MEPKKNISFQQIINLLQDDSSPFPASQLYRFSDLSNEELNLVKTAWPAIDSARRVHLLEDLEELALNNTLVLFDDIARFAMTDKDPDVCTAAINLLWECEDPRVTLTLIKLTQKENDSRVREAATAALGMFVELGELDKISTALRKRVEETLLNLLNAPESSTLRRHALESLGYSGRREVPPLIRAAYRSTDPLWIASSLFAMGRSADTAWEKNILQMLDHPDLDVQIEAVRASGALELRNARRHLMAMLEEYEDMDVELRRVTVWSLSQIGGKGVGAVLNALLENSEDDDEAAFIDEAIENLALNEEIGSFDILDIDASEESQRIVDLESEGWVENGDYEDDDE
ncbi:MAG: HEAT repeat domain-containing protein [Anaerolineaceae bacterium]